MLKLKRNGWRSQHLVDLLIFPRALFMMKREVNFLFQRAYVDVNCSLTNTALVSILDKLCLRFSRNVHFCDTDDSKVALWVLVLCNTRICRLSYISPWSEILQLYSPDKFFFPSLSREKCINNWFNLFPILTIDVNNRTLTRVRPRQSCFINLTENYRDRVSRNIHT